MLIKTICELDDGGSYSAYDDIIIPKLKDHRNRL